MNGNCRRECAKWRRSSDRILRIQLRIDIMPREPWGVLTPRVQPMQYREPERPSKLSIERTCELETLFIL